MLVLCFVLTLLLLEVSASNDKQQNPIESQRQQQQRGNLRHLTSNWTVTDGNHRRKIAAFYNLYCEGDHFDGVIKDQVKVMKDSGLMDKIDVVYYATIGRQGDNYTIPENKFKHLAHHGDTGGEAQTLTLLYDFCRDNKQSKVLYFHNKGSFHYNHLNVRFRQFLDCYNLNPHCIEALDTYDTCGWRISPVPHPHYSGNFWWATCKHINKLVHPMSGVYNETFIEVTKTLSPCIAMESRYFPETWIGSAPEFRPADCMSAAVDTSFLYGYKFPNGVVETYCPKRTTDSDGKETVEYGSKCGAASTMRDLPLFANTMDIMSKLSRCPVDPYFEILKRSRLWYGQEATTYIKWLEQMRAPPNITENELYRGMSSPTVYIVRDGVLRVIPNLQTFYTLGRDFDETIVIRDYQISALPHGDALPSV